QEIYKDRQKFSEQVFNVASSDLVNMGISVVSYTLKDIHDDQVTLGTWRGTVRMGTVTMGWGQETRTMSKHGAIIQAQGHPHCPLWLVGQWGVTLSPVPRTTCTRWARAAQPKCSAMPASERPRPRGTPGSATKQQIEEQRAQVLVVERAQRAQLQEHEIGRRELELEATVRKPAEAERYRLERLAEAQR
ncbi:FLOT1 protein, partial [Probosciger aterrimus]|nr:FLOT1 protein [Probosciger aterrimus]